MPSRPCWVEISARALEENFRLLRSLAPAQADLLAIVKADAYGHSLSICAPAFVRAGTSWLGVTSVEEGAAARTHCPNANILVIGGGFPGQGPAVVHHRLTPAVWEPFQLDELESAARAANAPPQSVPVHLELDTGMSRQGVSLDPANPGALHAILTRFTPTSPLKLEGLMTHLYAADESNGAATAEQLARLNSALARVRELGHRAEWLNVGQSAAVLSGQAAAIAALAARHGMKALFRPGLALYGLAPRFEPPPTSEQEEPPQLAAARTHLKPALTWKSQVVSVRTIPAGAVVGYNGTFVATEPMRLALVALGYADGLSRSLRNHFSLLVHGQRAPIAGRISMDQTVLDVTDIPDVQPGDEVVILGAQGRESATPESISAFDLADAAGTIPWEVFTRISARVTRLAV
jgi:alanine racemase